MVNVCVFSNFKFYLSRSNEPPSIQNRPVLSSNYKVEVQQGVIYRTQLISETTSTKVKQTVRGTTIKSHLSSLNGHPSIPSVFPSSNYKVEVQQSVSYRVLYGVLITSRHYTLVTPIQSIIDRHLSVSIRISKVALRLIVV